MKNKIFALILSAIAVVGFNSCSDYLDRTPLDSNSDATNWTSESALQIYSWSLYSDISGYAYGSGWTRGQYHSESITDDYAADSYAEFTKNIPTYSSSWSTPYTYIRKANILYNRVDLVPDLSKEAANHWKGVACFFRALHHFALLKTYGDIVWVDDELTDLSNDAVTKKSRDSRIVVANNIIADLQFATDNLYSPEKAGANTINCYVAAALLSRVALYEAAWEKYHSVSGGDPASLYTIAKNAANKVIESGNYAIGEDYRAPFVSLDLAGNKEVLLYRIYSVANVNGGKVTSGHSAAGWSDSSTPTWGLTKSAMENYTNINGIPTHMAKYNDQTLAGIFTGRDKRLAATVFSTDLYLTGVAGDDGIVSTTGFWTWKFVPLDKRDAMKSNGTWNGPSNDTDGPIFLYSEVLENYAEACAELGNCTQADLDKSVNVLRVKHGGIPPLTVAGDAVSVNGTVITKDPSDPAANVLIQEIRRDRRSELMCDGFRYDDLMRWKLGEKLDFAKNPDGYKGVSKAALKAYAYAAGKTDSDWNGAHTADNPGIEWANFWTKDGYKSAFFTNDVEANALQTGSRVNRVWDDKYYLEPIPSGQITLDENLGQNPGW